MNRSNSPLVVAVTLSILAVGQAGCRTHSQGVERVCSNDIAISCTSAADCAAGATCIDAATAQTFVVLKPMGFTQHQVYPGQELSLRVLAMRSAGTAINDASDLRPMEGEVIAWQINALSTDASLSAAASLTSADGIAGISVNTGAQQGMSFQVQANLTGADPVFFTVQVLVDARELRLLTPSLLNSVVSRTERLRVQLVRGAGGGLGIPVPNETLQVEVIGGIGASGARLVPDPGDQVSITTDLTGIATVRFRTGTTASRDYAIVFCGGVSCAGVQPQTITVHVAARGNTQGCQYFTDCDPGFTCVASNCELAATYCSGDSECPTGYACGAGRVCELAPAGNTCTSGGDCTASQSCGSSGFCIDTDGCQTNADCAADAGWSCHIQTGACVPPDTPTTPVVDVRGPWLTRYHFDLSDTLPGFFTNGLGPIVDFLDLLFRSQLEINVPIIGDILEAWLDSLINEYVPPWVRTVVLVLGDFIHLFENMEVEGEMALYQPGTPIGVNVSGEEDWTSTQFFIASLCPGGIQQFNQDRSCGAVDVVLYPEVNLDYSNNDPDVGVNVRPFAGQVRPAAPADPLQFWTLNLFGRRVDIELSQLINVLLDVIVTAASDGQWYDFEEFLTDIVPCYDLQMAIDDLACDITDGDICSIPGIEAMCDAAAAAAITSLTDQLGSIALRVLRLDFDQISTVHDDGSTTAPYGIQLGNPQSPAAESSIIGDTQALSFFSGDFDANSWWYGER